MDEPAQLVAGISHWEFGRFELYRVTGPIVRLMAALPVLFAGYDMDWSGFHDAPGSRVERALGSDFARLNGSRCCWLITLARWSCIPLNLLGGYVCFRWARELSGASAGLLALTLWCFSPNILGHAQLITTDAAGAALCVMAAWLLRAWLNQSTWFGSIGAGVGLGLAQLAKATFLVLYPLWLFLWIAWRSTDAVSADPKRRRAGWRTDTAQMAVILLTSLYVLNLGYGFEGTLRRLGEYEFVSASLAGERIEGQLSGNRFADTWAASLPVPVPENYVRGIDTQRSQFELGLDSYLGGEWRRSGWWYYYLYGLAVKVPLGTWLLLCGACVYTVHMKHLAWREEMLLLCPMVALLVLVSSQTGINKNVRYVLPVLPFAFIWVSRVGTLSGSDKTGFTQ